MAKKEQKRPEPQKQQDQGFQPKGVKFDIDNGESFFADEAGVMHNPLKLIMDFRGITPRIDIRNRSFQPIIVKHNVVVMDIYTAKNFLDILKTNIDNYEKKFGKITKPKALEVLERDSQRSPEMAKPTMVDTDTAEDMPTYFG